MSKRQVELGLDQVIDAYEKADTVENVGKAFYQIIRKIAYEIAISSENAPNNKGVCGTYSECVQNYQNKLEEIPVDKKVYSKKDADKLEVCMGGLESNTKGALAKLGKQNKRIFKIGISRLANEDNIRDLKRLVTVLDDKNENWDEIVDKMDGEANNEEQ